MASIPSLANIGLSALRASQTALSTAGHNIANVNTEGYSRQRVELRTATPQNLNGLNLGNGVDIRTVSRVVSSAVNTQLQVQTSNSSDASKFLDLANRIDNVLADTNTGLTPALSSFFSAAQEVADNPSSSIERQVLLSEADNLARRFQVLDDRLEDLDTLVNAEVRDTVSEVNALAQSVAELNQQISTVSARASEPNDLLDRRDQLILQIGERVGISTVDLGDGTVNVMVGGSQGLVLGTQTNPLQVVSSVFDATQLEVANDAGININSQITGGTLGGALRFRDEVLTGAQNALGRVAAGVVEGFNAQHRLGMDFNGNLGGDFFVSTAPQVVANVNNTGGSATAALTDVNGLTTSDYLLTFDGANAYTLTRQSDGQTTAINTGGASPFTTTTIDGFTLTLTAGAAVGDTFRIRPVADNADQMRVALTDPARLAAASPVRAESAFANSGNGAVSDVTVNSVVNLPLSGAPVSGQLVATFNSTTNQLTLVPDPSGESPLAYDPATDGSGKTFSILGGDVSFTLSGTPANGDTFSFSHNAGGVSDNRNALALVNLQDSLTLAGGTATFQDAYGQLVTQVGIQTRDAQTSNSAFGALLEQATNDRQTISGVNLDEEAADLVKFQQAYQASAQLLSVVDELFQSILSAVRR